MTPAGNPLTAERLARALKAGTRAALARPRARLSVVPLLARELGRRQRRAYDLATAPVPKLRFDALQTFLINADVAVSSSRRAGGASRTAASLSRRDGGASRRATAAADGTCDQLDAVMEPMPFNKLSGG